MKMDKKAKIKMVKEHIEEFVTLKELEEKYGVGIDHIKYMIALYRKHGEKSFSEMPVGIIVFNEEKMIEWANSYAKKIFLQEKAYEKTYPLLRQIQAVR